MSTLVVVVRNERRESKHNVLNKKTRIDRSFFGTPLVRPDRRNKLQPERNPGQYVPEHATFLSEKNVHGHVMILVDMLDDRHATSKCGQTDSVSNRSALNSLLQRFALQKCCHKSTAQRFDFKLKPKLSVAFAS